MGWNPTDEDVRTTISESVAPPSALDAILGDEVWSGIFSMWCTDVGYVGGDYQASHLYSLWRDYAYGTDWQRVKATYVDGDGPMALVWPSYVDERFGRLAAGMEHDGAAAMSELWAAASEMFDPYVDAFLADIAELQSGTPGTPTAVGLTRDRIDMGVVDSINEAALKATDEGEFVDYVQYGDVVLIGGDHAASYTAYVRSNGGAEGRIWMQSKGSFGSHGELLVQGCYYEQSDAFNAAIRRVSKKKITMDQ